PALDDQHSRRPHLVKVGARFAQPLDGPAHFRRVRSLPGAARKLRLRVELCTAEAQRQQESRQRGPGRETHKQLPNTRACRNSAVPEMHGLPQGTIGPLLASKQVKAQSRAARVTCVSFTVDGSLTL